MKRPCENAPNQVAKKSPKEAQTTNKDESIDIEQLPPEKKLSMKVREKKQLVKKKAKLIITVNSDTHQEENDEANIVRESTTKIGSGTDWNRPQFFVQDLQRVVLYGLIGTHYRFFPRWCKILRPNHLKSVNLVTINNVSEYDFKNSGKKFKKVVKPFQDKNGQLSSIEFVSPHANNRDFYSEFNPVPITRTQWIKLRDEGEYKEKLKQVVKKYKKTFIKLRSKTDSSSSSEVSSSELDKIPRTSLLLNPVQMIRENYPLPFDTTTKSNTDYVPTKDEYEPVSDKSPLFALDCEMCFNEDGEMELVWFAMVDESLQLVYETFVKPRKPIRRYLTSITGITEKTLENVKVDLSEVQAKLREFLPKDAILCGQSLNNDFHALKMFHPYVIDTSIIYNSSGSRDIKSSLKNLSAQYLGKLIQESTHNPTIDARASMQLVLLKLRRGFDFGDVIVNGCTAMFDEEASLSADDLLGFDQVDFTNEESIRKFIYQTGLNVEQNFFDVLKRNSISNVYIDRVQRDLSDSTEFHLTKDNESTFNTLIQSLNKSKFTWSQFYVSNSGDGEDQEIDKNDFKECLSHVRKIYEKLEDDSMLMIAFTGRSDEKLPDRSYANDLLRGRCFLKIKNERIEQLDAEIGQLFDIVNPERKKEMPASDADE